MSQGRAKPGVSVTGKTALIVILVAGGLGFIIALAGSPGIGSPSGKVVYVVAVSTNKQAERPE